MIIPKLPAEAIIKAKAARDTNRPSFHRIPYQSERHDCKNCGDLTRVIVSTATSGPYKFPPRSATMMFFEGDGVVAKGWYIVETNEYRCPECQIGSYIPPIVNEEKDDQDSQQEIPF